MRATKEAILIRPIKMSMTTPSGIEVKQDRQRHDANISIGVILDIGPLAFTEEMYLEKEFNINVPRPKVGDYVITAKHAGYELKVGDEVYKFCGPLDLIGLTTEEEVEEMTTWH